MKKNLLSVLFTLLIHLSTAQITAPVIRANFGVDADLSANYFNGLTLFGNDDWFKNSRFGTGDFMIDTSGAANILALYSSNPSTRRASFSRIMKPAFYSTVNNKLVIDAVFHRDFHGDDSTVFAAGSNKNGMSPAGWSCPVAQGIPDKNEILDAFTHVRRDGANVTDSLWMFGGISLENTNGNRYFDFELYQTNITYNRPSRTFSGFGPNAGHTTWQFDAAGNVTTAGDIIFSAEYSSSSLTLIQARIWINKNSLTTTPVNFNWGGQFDGDGAAAIFGYATIVPKTTGTFYTGLQSVATTWAGPFALVRQDNSVVNDYTGGQFMEFSVNLTKLGVDPGSYSNNPCGTPFRRVLIKTRSSTSFTSELKDFIAPFRMFDFPPVDAFAPFPYFCGVFPPTAIDVLNPNPNTVYTWNTSNGNIVGSNTGTSIIVDRPGTYHVLQQLNSQCPFFSRDSVTIFFDSVCRVLDIKINDLKVIRQPNYTTIAWEVTNNKEAANYYIEYSTDGVHFKRLATINANPQNNAASYMHQFSNSITGAVIYFRIKAESRDGRTALSNTFLLRNDIDNKNAAAIFPNPSAGELWVAVKSATTENAAVMIWDAQGKLISTTTVNIVPGQNILQLHGLTGYTEGIYFVKVKSTSIDISKKVLKIK